MAVVAALFGTPSRPRPITDIAHVCALTMGFLVVQADELYTRRLERDGLRRGLPAGTPRARTPRARMLLIEEWRESATRACRRASGREALANRPGAASTSSALGAAYAACQALTQDAHDDAWICWLRHNEWCRLTGALHTAAHRSDCTLHTHAERPENNALVPAHHHRRGAGPAAQNDQHRSKQRTPSAKRSSRR